MASALQLAAADGMGLTPWLGLAGVRAQQADLTAWRAAQPLAAAAAFFVGDVAVTALSLPGATAMALAAGAVLGLG